MSSTSFQLYEAAMTAQTEEEAAAHVDRIIAYLMQSDLPGHPHTIEEAQSLALHNIGYIAGYYTRETYERVMRLYQTAHPIFGAAYPTSEEAIKKGQTT